MRSRRTSSRIRENLLCGIVVCLLAVNGLNAESCKTGCPSSDSGLLQYVPGKVYEYSIDSLLTVGISGNDADETSLKVSGLAKLFAEGNCGYTLQLDKIVVSAAKENLEKEITQSIQKPIKFTMVGGELQPEICADPSDSAAALNIKRGIISLLQAADKPYETDVFGVCSTLTSVSKAGPAEIITKVRNLNSCSYREQVANGLVSGVVNSKAGIKSTALLNADYSKELKLARGIPESIQLVEEYKFAALANGAGVAKAKVRTNLKLGKVGKANAPALNGASASIIFENPTLPAIKNGAVLKKVFTNTVNLVNNHVQGDAAQYFGELIRLMRSSDAETLIELSVVPHVNKQLARKVYLDALFRVGTSNAVKAIVRQVSKMSEQEKKLAFLSLNLVKSVEKDALNQAATLLNPNSPKEAYLAIGNLVNKYCKQGTCDQSEVNVVSKKFADGLKRCKANVKKDEDRFVNILKGIRNTHKIADASAQILAECASADRTSRLRVAALQAFTACPCDAGLQAKSLSILKDVNEDSEIRIEAYLALIACPTAQLANEIAEIVNKEPVNQVGGFISSSLKAIRDSTDASREASRHYLGNIRVTKKFPIDPRRFSFNSEISYAVESLGIGASADYSLIYSQNGYLPRSGRLNLTSEIFGSNFNLLEVSARQENLEEILAYYLGPKGYFKNEGRNLISSIASKSRSKRSILDDTGKFAKKYKSYGSRSTSDINLDLAIRVFGSELFFLSLADDVPQTVDAIINKFTESAAKLKDSVKKFEHEYSCHALFLDTELVYPTGVGLPLELIAQGTSTTKLGVAVEVEVDSIIDNPSNTKYRLKFVPSVDVQVTGKIGFNALVIAASLRASSSLHSATGSDVKFELINDATGFNMDIELPRENLKLIDFKHNVEFVVAEQDKETKVVPLKIKKKKNASEESCFDQLHYIGMVVCFTSVLPDTSKGEAVSFPLSGPIRVALRLQAEKKINIRGTYDKTPEMRLWKLKYSTPGSQVNHDTELGLKVGMQPKMFIRAELLHNEMKLSGEAGIRSDDSEISIYGQYDMNGDVTIQKIGLAKNGDEYRPLIEIKTSQGVLNEIYGYRADGRIIKQGSGDKVRFVYDNLQVIGKEGEPIVLNGWAEANPYKAEVTIQQGKEGYEIKSHLSLQDEYSAGLFIRNLNSAQVNGGSITVQLGTGSLKSALVVSAADYSLEMNNDFQESKDDKQNIENVIFKNDLKVLQAKSPIIQGKLNGEINSNKVQLNLEVSKDKKKASLDLNLAQNQRAQGDASLDMSLKLNQYFLDLKGKMDVKGARLVGDASLASSWGTQLTAKGEVGQRLTAQDIFIDLQGTFLLTPKDKQGSWLLKVVGTPDKTNGDFKLSRDNADLIALNVETSHPQDKVATGKANLQVKDLLGAKADFKVNKAGKGDLSALLNFKKAQRKITLDSKFTIASPKYDVEATIGYDNDKKLILKTENIVDKNKVVTKNLLDFNGQKVQLDANGVVKGEWRLNGELDGSLTLTIPNGRQFNAQGNRKVTTGKNGMAQGAMSLNLVDKLPSNEQRSLKLGGTLEKYNPKTKEITAQSNLIYTSLSGKSVEISNSIKNLLKNGVQSVNYNLKGQGDLLASPIDFSFIVDEYTEDNAVFRISGNWGDGVNTNLNGNYNLGGRAKPVSYDLQVTIAAPKTFFKTYSLRTSGKYLRSETEDGVTSVEFNLDEQAGENTVKLSALAKGNRNHGSYNLDLSSSRLPSPLKLDGSFNLAQQDEENGKQKYDLNYSYGDKFIKNSVELEYSAAQAAVIHYLLQTSFESVKNLDLEVRSTKLDDSVNVNSALKLNGQNYNLDITGYTGEHKKGAVVKAVLPQATTTLSGIVEILGERKAKLTLNIVNLGDLNLEHTSEANLKTFDDFYLTAQTNAPKLKIEALDMDIRTQGGADGKGVSVNIKDAKGVILTGTCTYAVKKEKSKTIIEGQGQVQYGSTKSNANFKIVHQLFDVTAHQEIGYSLTFSGNFGPKNAVSNLKLTNKNFEIKVSVCEGKKQCTHVDISSVAIMDPNDLTTSQHQLIVVIDLRELGFPYEYTLKSKINRKGLKFNQDLESSITSSNNIKYQLLASLAPLSRKVQIKLPNREIAIETENVIPKNVFGHYQSSLVFYFDRLNKPNDVTKLVASADISGVEKTAINGKGEIRFEHPTIRTLSVSGIIDLNREQRLISSEAVFDVFRTPEQKIIATTVLRDTNPKGSNGFNVTTEYKIKSAGLGIQYALSGHSALSVEQKELSAGFSLQSGVADIKGSGWLYGNPSRVEVDLNAFNEPLVNLAADINTGKVVGNFQIFALKPLNLVGEVNKNSAKVQLKRAGLFDVIGEVKLGKEAKLIIKDGSKKLISGRVALDAAHFLTTTFDNSEEDIKAFLASVEKIIEDDTKATNEQLQKRFQKTREALERQANLAKDSVPDFSALGASIKDNANEILQTLENDPAIKAFLDNYRKYYETALKFYQEISKTIADSYKQILDLVNELWAKVQDIMKQTVLPAWEEFTKRITVILGELQQETVKLVTSVLEQMLKVLKSMENDLKALGKPVYEILKPIAESFEDLLQALAKDLDALFADLVEYWSKLPTFDAIKDEIKQKLAKLKAVDEILSFLRNVIDQLGTVSATPETTELAQKLYNYIEAKLRDTPVNDIDALEDIMNALVNAVNSLWKRFVEFKPPKAELISALPISLDLLTSLPVWISVRFSVLNFLLNEKMDGVTEWLELIKPPLSMLPPYNLVGHIADGKNIFTFDGQQFSFQGSCKYILTQDSDGNDFSVVATVKDGKLKAVTVIDSKNFVEISDNGAVKLNGKATEYPVHVDDIHAWRRYYTQRILTENGVEVACTTDLKVCHVTVNGFYTSKTRGLLGNGNAEPFDDFTTVDGKITSSPAELVNDYSLGNCPAVAPTAPAKAEHNALCTELFGLDSDLIMGYLFIDPRPYRKACDEVVLQSPDNKEEVACNIALSYASAGRLANLPVFVPERCLKCSGGAGQKTIGDEFTVKIPTNKADIVFVVDTNSSKNVIDNLVTPAISEVRNQLKTRGLTDVQIAVIAFNNEQLYPALLTSNGGKLNYNGKLSSVELNGPRRSEPLDVGVPVLNDIITTLEEILRDTSPQVDEKAFRLALEYPFRAPAAKSIVIVRNEQLEYNLSKLVRAFVMDLMTEFDGASLHMLAPVKDLAVDGVPPEKLVGFNSRIIATTEGRDVKKRQKLKFSNDMGIDFVLQNNGWVFATQNFEAIPSEDQKKFVNQVTSSIADTLFKTDIVSECKCVASYGLHAEHVCSIKSSNFVPNKRPKGA